MTKCLNKKTVLKAMKRLDELAPHSFEMIVGGGAAMMCAYDCPLTTVDMDVVFKYISGERLEKPVRQIAREMNLPGNWLNSWYAGFTHYLPSDFNRRLKLIFQGQKITARALGAEDMLILKCCAHRTKDTGHARVLIRRKADHIFVMKHLEKLMEQKRIFNEKPLEFLEDILEKENVEL